MNTTLLKQNLAMTSDSYKMGHHHAYVNNVTRIYSYFEARKGAKYAETVFFGLQFLLKELAGQVITQDDVDVARDKMKSHFWGNDKMFNYEGWTRLVQKHNGKLPIEIKAVAEGTPVPIDNVLFTIVNTDDEFPWLTNFLETYLTHVWHPATVASLSRQTKKLIKNYLDKTSVSEDLLPFMLHDFGYRGVENVVGAGRGGAGHLVNFVGTDTVAAMEYIEKFYNVPFEGIGYSVFATEHSIMTSRGENGEPEIIQDVLNKFPIGIVSIVADSFDYYRFVSDYVGKRFKQQIIQRNNENGKIAPTKFVIRPDSVTPTHKTPEELVLWTFQQLESDFGCILNEKGYKMIHPSVGVIWGDGIDYDGIEKILEILQINKYDTAGCVFGSGGGLLQKINRDTQRFAFKCSAQLQGDKWVDIQKNPLDKSKKSKAGRLALIKDQSGFHTIREEELGDRENLLKTVFLNGDIVKEFNFNEVRENAKL